MWGEDEPDDICAGCGDNLTYFVGGTRYSRVTSVEVRGVYDGGLYYAHPLQSGGCGFAWHRWEEISGRYNTKHLRDKAQPFIDSWNRRYFDANPDRAKTLGHNRPK